MRERERELGKIGKKNVYKNVKRCCTLRRFYYSDFVLPCQISGKRAQKHVTSIYYSKATHWRCIHGDHDIFVYMISTKFPKICLDWICLPDLNFAVNFDEILFLAKSDGKLRHLYVKRSEFNAIEYASRRIINSNFGQSSIFIFHILMYEEYQIFAFNAFMWVNTVWSKRIHEIYNLLEYCRYEMQLTNFTFPRGIVRFFVLSLSLSRNFLSFHIFLKIFFVLKKRQLCWAVPFYLRIYYGDGSTKALELNIEMNDNSKIQHIKCKMRSKKLQPPQIWSLCIVQWRELYE